MDNNDPEFQQALAKVQSEFEILTAGLNSMNAKDAFHLREYVLKRTDPTKPEAELTHEQRAWLILYKSLDEQMTTAYGKESVSNVDQAKSAMDEVELVEENFEKLVSIGRRIEESLILQRTRFAVHFESDNRYRTNEEYLSEQMVAESTPPEKKVGLAKQIIELNKKYDEIAIAPMGELQDRVYQLLVEFKAIYNSTPFHALAHPSITTISEKYKQYLEFSDQLYEARLMALTGIRNLMELDKVIPLAMIESNGETKSISAEAFAERAGAGQYLVKEASAKEDTIQATRYQLTVELYGEPDNYMHFEEDPQTQQQKSQGPTLKERLEAKPWYRFAKVVYILACIVAVGVSGLFLYADIIAGGAIAITACILLYGVKRAFLYIATGKSKLE
jgi:hypothetical protein